MRYIKPYTPIFKIACILFFCAMLVSCAKTPMKEIDTQAMAQDTQHKLEDNEDESIIEEDIAAQEDVTSLTIGVLKNTSTLHPLFFNNEQMENVLSLIFEPAIKMDSTDTPSASIIENWEVDDKGEEYTFHVRKNVKFHDSEDTVTADDIMFALDKIMELDEDECKYSAYKGCVKNYEMVDEYTISVSLKRSTDDIFYLFGFPVFSSELYAPLPKSTLKTPVGTGGYKVKNFDAETGLELEQNEDWWRLHGNIEDICVKYYKDNSDILLAYREGEIDTLINTDISASSLTTNARSTLHYTTTQYYDALVPNCSTYPTNIKEIRKGISYALSRDDIISQCLRGEASSAMTPLRMDKWYMNGVETAEDNNKNLANSCFGTAGFVKAPNGKLETNGIQLKLKLIYYDTSETGYKSNVAAVIRTQLADYGIDVDIKKLSKSEFLDAVEENDYDLALCSFYTTANDDLSIFFGNNAKLNYGDYTGESIDDLIRDAEDVYGEEEVRESYTALYDYLIENVPHISLYHRSHSIVLPSGISNVGLIRFKSVFTDINTWKKS